MPSIPNFPFRFGPAPCCCPSEDCWVFQDDFQREDSTDLGDDWNEAAGTDWEVLEGRLHEKVGGGGTVGAMVFGTNPVGDGDSGGEMFIRVRIVDAEIGDVFSIFGCCETNSSVGSGVEVTYEKTDDNEWLITIDGGPEAKTQTTTDDDPEVYACFDGRVGMVTAGLVLSTDERAWDDNLDPGDGLYYALGHGNEDNGAWFDDFYVLELYTGTTECTNCVCQCLWWGLKKHLVGTITDCELLPGSPGTGRNLLPCCTAGQEFDLIYDFSGAQGPGWYGTWINSLDPPGAFSIDIFLECGSSWWLFPDWPGRNIVISFQPGFGANVSADPPIAEESECQELALVYGWYRHQVDTIPPVDITQYKIVVTEA